MSESNELALPAELCPNCNAALIGPYCANCGQQQIATKNLLVTFVNEAFDDIFSFSSRAWKTTIALFFKPGFLSVEYSAGRRKRYIQPLRLYLITSIVFFLVLSITNFFNVGGDIVIGDEADQPQTVEQISDQDAALKDDAPLDSASSEPSSASEPATQPTDAAGVSAEQAKEGEKAVAEEPDQEDDWVLFDPADGNLPFMDEQETQRANEIIKRQVNKARQQAKENPRELISEVIDILPPIAFILLPIYALIMMLFYPFKRRYYAEHLVLAVHNHCFLFACLTLLILVPLIPLNLISDNFGDILFFWMPIYMYLSLLRMHRQGKLLTLIKFIMLFIAYFVLVGAGALLTALIGLLIL